MKGLFSLFLLFSIACNLQKQKPDGAYIKVAGKYEDLATPKENIEKYQTEKIFKNGYWISTTFTQESVIKCCGGTYKSISGSYIQKFNFNSTDTSVINKEYSCKYDVDDKFLTETVGTIDTHKKKDSKNIYQKINTTEPLKNASLEGVWIMKPGQGGYNTNNDEVIRIFAYPCFTRTIY